MIKRVVGAHIFGQFKKREMIYFSQKKKHNVTEIVDSIKKHRGSVFLGKYSESLWNNYL
jgi:chemotaxis methyl-accepting protein methylase